MTPDPERVAALMDAIRANQERFERTRGLRKQYRICVENERPFAELGIHFPPMWLPGLVGWWLKRGAP